MNKNSEDVSVNLFKILSSSYDAFHTRSTTQKISFKRTYPGRICLSNYVIFPRSGPLFRKTYDRVGLFIPTTNMDISFASRVYILSAVSLNRAQIVHMSNERNIALCKRARFISMPIFRYLLRKKNVLLREPLRLYMHESGVVHW